MKPTTFYLAGDYLEHYQVSPGVWKSIHFFLSEESEYCNALDLMHLLDYKDVHSAWKRTYNKLKDELGKIECQYVYTDGTTEDFINLNQVIEVIADTSRWGKGEKMRFGEWLSDAAPWTFEDDDEDTLIWTA
ncbi:hypothetical protein H6F88_31800 [Oculatella sp. FACHB-28]|uniref:hypothetical protein n=1 Tax=Oculatella sp. FACHB-28 TaxID=2692845 RepID=UPI001685253D|nr:hypothetical protein [Oculatella sp. FACHB-28]MBD2060528.1 hypothetical protein [Oculatella sp. FACHB-28]